MLEFYSHICHRFLFIPQWAIKFGLADEFCGKDLRTICCRRTVGVAATQRQVHSIRSDPAA